MNPTIRIGRIVSWSALFLFALLCAGRSDAANSLGRDEDPFVISGAFLPPFTGVNPDSIVAFRYQSGWIQIPVQVDERDVVDFGVPYDTTSFGVTALMYTDDGTFTGPDTDAGLDDDDELVFMAKDAGDERVPWAFPDPPGVLPFTRNELVVGNPINGHVAYVYLFVSDGTLGQGAAADYVDYNFDLLSGDYKTTYSILAGPNLENTEVVTNYYRIHFSDRWIRDELNVNAGAATGVDILDRHKNLFGPGNCGRSENTFSAGEGCFVANIDGPVRAIRSYLGANSGPFTQRTHLFYERRHDVTTYLRVHAISGVMDFYDYSPAADSMVYYNDLNTGGATIDGDPAGDSITSGPIEWEMVTGAQGTLVMAERLFEDIPGFAYTSYYSDDATPSVTQCTGDAYEYGASGVWVNQPIPNTDPFLGAHYRFEAARVVYYDEPDRTVARALALVEQANNPVGLYIPTGVAGNTAPAVPVLMQNVPNPFSDKTTIRFRPQPGSGGILRVYDVSGRLVTVLSGAQGEVTWDGTDTNGSRVPAGIYFYRLVANQAAQTRKMVLIR